MTGPNIWMNVFFTLCICRDRLRCLSRLPATLSERGVSMILYRQNLEWPKRTITRLESIKTEILKVTSSADVPHSRNLVVCLHFSNGMRSFALSNTTDNFYVLGALVFWVCVGGGGCGNVSRSRQLINNCHNVDGNS